METAMSQNFQPYYRRHLLQFGGVNLSVEAADLTKIGTIRILAWVVRYFVAHVSQDPLSFWRSMAAGEPLQDYMTHSDLSLAVLVLEHHVMKWRHLLQVEQETGKPPSDEYSRKARGLLYDDGIAGEEAKRRFDTLCIYFYTNFYATSCPDATRSMNCLQNILDVAVRKDAALIQAYVTDSSGGGIQGSLLEDIKDDILHRVFYHIFL